MISIISLPQIFADERNTGSHKRRRTGKRRTTDFFLDGFITDYLVQSKISDAREDIEVGILYVKTILDELYRKLELLELY